MKVLITGSNGFIGKNLITHLREIQDISIVPYDVNDDFKIIEENIHDIDFIIHLAGVNRTQQKQQFYDVNRDLTKKIVDLIADKDIPLLVSSSIQAIQKNDYGQSKKEAEDYIISHLEKYYIYRLHNVFGKWSRPNYNSVIATFCYNISHHLDIHIDHPQTQLELIYIDDVVNEFIRVLRGSSPDEIRDGYCYINPRYKVTLEYIKDKLYEFQDNMHSIYVPNTGNDFIKKLFSTYVSYMDVSDLSMSTTQKVNEKGAFVELLRTKDSGQISISFTKSKIVRGGHFHHTKMERFFVIKGKARIRLRNLLNNEQYSFEVDDTDIKVITIPVGFTHDIENIGTEEMVLMIWSNELFDQNHPDTYYKPVDELKNIGE